MRMQRKTEHVRACACDWIGRGERKAEGRSKGGERRISTVWEETHCPVRLLVSSKDPAPPHHPIPLSLNPSLLLSPPQHEPHTHSPHTPRRFESNIGRDGSGRCGLEHFGHMASRSSVGAGGVEAARRTRARGVERVVLGGVARRRHLGRQGAQLGGLSLPRRVGGNGGIGNLDIP